jgi:hypothetical protein
VATSQKRQTKFLVSTFRRGVTHNVAGEADARLGDDLAEDGKHGDAAVLDLDVAEAVELVLVAVGDEAQRVPEVERRLRAHLGLEGLDGRRRAGHRRRREGGGGGESEGGNDLLPRMGKRECFRVARERDCCWQPLWLSEGQAGGVGSTPRVSLAAEASGLHVVGGKEFWVAVGRYLQLNISRSQA